MKPRRSARTGAETWFKGDLHVHSIHSDGKHSVKELAAEADRRQLDFVAITDHNTISQLRDITRCDDDHPLLLPGEEITTYNGHANVWGNRRWMEFRCRTLEEMSRLIDEAHKDGLLFSINHPNDLGPDWTLKEIRGFDCIEVFCGLWPRMNFQSLNWWEQLLKEGNRVVAVGGSDLHSIGDFSTRDIFSLGTPTTWVQSDGLSQDAVIDAIRKGHVFMSQGPDGPFVSLEARSDGNNRTASMGDQLSVPKSDAVDFQLRVQGAKGEWASLVLDGENYVTIELDKNDFVGHWEIQPDGHRYCRAEILSASSDLKSDERQDQEVIALSNPIYLRYVS